MPKGWIGFDLDGTLARYKGWDGIENIGEPIEDIVELAKQYIKEGKEIRIVTARATVSAAIPYIQDWCEENGLGRPVVTNVKDFDMVALYDDRSVQVVTNEGIVLEEHHKGVIDLLSARCVKAEAELKELKWRMEGLEK